MAQKDDDETNNNGGDDCRDECIWTKRTQGVPCFVRIAPLLGQISDQLGLFLTEIKEARTDYRLLVERQLDRSNELNKNFNPDRYISIKTWMFLFAAGLGLLGALKWAELYFKSQVP